MDNIHIYLAADKSTMLFNHFNELARFRIKEYRSIFSADTVDATYKLFAETGAPEIIHLSDDEYVSELWVYFDYSMPGMPITSIHASLYDDIFCEAYDYEPTADIVFHVVIDVSPFGYVGYISSQHKFILPSVINNMCSEHIINTPAFIEQVYT